MTNHWNNDWNTFYREVCIAGDANRLVSQLWVQAEPNSEGESILECVRGYLQDRFDIALAFCDVITGREIKDLEITDDDIPF